jgi:type I restriction enzyme S subunit
MINEVELGNAFDFIRNGASIKQADNKGGYPISRIETIWNETIDSERLGFADIFDEEISKYEKYILQDGDILMTHINSPKHLGKCAIYKGIPEKLIHGMNLLCLRPNTDITLPQYILYFFNSKFFRELLPSISNQSVNQASFNVGKLKELQIPLPPLATQQKIAAILDAADELKQKDKALVAKYDELTQALFLDMFGDPVTNPKGWEKVQFEDCLIIRNGKNQKKVENPAGKYPIYGSGGIMSYADNYICEENTVIIGRKGNINKPILVREKYWNVDTAFGLHPLLNKLSYQYLFYFCVRYNFEQHNQTVTIPSLTKSTLLRVIIPLPALKLQNQFAERVKVIEEQKSIAQASALKSEELFNSLLQKAFNGELL